MVLGQKTIHYLTNRVICQGRNLLTVMCRRASTYDGDGKTAAMVLNKELEFIMINAYSSVGFRLNSGIRIFGPSIIFPRTVLSWNIGGLDDVNEASLSLFKILDPKVDIIVLGYGNNQQLSPEFRSVIKKFSKKNSIGFEVLPTEKAIPTFNYLVHEKRLVAAALIPPKVVHIYDDNDRAHVHQRQQMLLGEI